MKIKKIFNLVLCLGLLTVVLPSCGDDTEDPESLPVTPEENEGGNQTENNPDKEPEKPSEPQNKIIITEVYCGNSKYTDENGKTETLQKDKYIKLYNNCNEKAVLKNFCIAFAFPFMSNNTGSYEVYENEDWTPATQAIWSIDIISFEPYEEKVFVVNSPEDYTAIGGCNLANKDYYCLIDLTSDMNNTNFYTAPTLGNVCLKPHQFANGTSWTIGFSPALFIFSTGDIPVETFVADENNHILLGSAEFWGKNVETGKYSLKTGASLKIPNSYILDGVDVANFTTEAVAKKYSRRLPDAVDKGYVKLTANGEGHSLCRKIDEEKSPSEGSYKVYQDTDNSCEDFYESEKASLKN